MCLHRISKQQLVPLLIRSSLLSSLFTPFPITSGENSLSFALQEKPLPPPLEFDRRASGHIEWWTERDDLDLDQQAAELTNREWTKEWRKSTESGL